MTLSPHHSLLALLMITAVVASSVKRWNGPFRVVLINPTNAALEVLTQAIPQPGFKPGTTIECRYRNTRSGRELLTLQCKYPDPLPVIAYSRDWMNRGFLFEAALLKAFPHKLTSDGEEAVCWVSGKLEIVYKPSPRVFDNPHYGPAYVITSLQQIYRARLLDLHPMIFEKVKLEDVQDAEVRTQIQNVIAKLPKS